NADAREPLPDERAEHHGRAGIAGGGRGQRQQRSLLEDPAARLHRPHSGPGDRVLAGDPRRASRRALAREVARTAACARAEPVAQARPAPGAGCLRAMTERAVWRPRWYLSCALGLGSLALLHAHLPWLLRGYSIYPVLVVLFALLCLAAALWELPPATMACAAIALTIFSGSWSYLGIPGVPFDRILLAGVALALLLGAPGASRVPRIRVGGVHLLLGLTIVYVAGSAAVAGTLTSE